MRTSGLLFVAIVSLATVTAAQDNQSMPSQPHSGTLGITFVWIADARSKFPDDPDLQPLAAVLPQNWVSGVLVTAVDPASPADSAGIKPGSIVTAIGDTLIYGNDSVSSFAKTAVPNHDYSVTFFQYDSNSSSWIQKNGDITLTSLHEAKKQGATPVVAATQISEAPPATMPSPAQHVVHHETPEDFDAFCKNFVDIWNSQGNYIATTSATPNSSPEKYIRKASITSTDVCRTDSISHPIVGVLSLDSGEGYTENGEYTWSDDVSVVVTFAVENGQWKVVKATRRLNSDEGKSVSGNEIEQNRDDFARAAAAAN